MEETSAKVQYSSSVVASLRKGVHVPLHTCSRKISQISARGPAFRAKNFRSKLLAPSPDPSASAGGPRGVVKREENLQKLCAMNSKGDEKRSARGGGGSQPPPRGAGRERRARGRGRQARSGKLCSRLQEASCCQRSQSKQMTVSITAPSNSQRALVTPRKEK